VPRKLILPGDGYSLV